MTKRKKLEEDCATRWNNAAREILMGKSIVSVRYLTNEEMENVGFQSRPVGILLDSGVWIFPSMDDEGNEAGALFTTHKEHGVLPVLPPT